jgi:hypothetical protein
MNCLRRARTHRSSDSSGEEAEFRHLGGSCFARLFHLFLHAGYDRVSGDTVLSFFGHNLQ